MDRGRWRLGFGRRCRGRGVRGLLGSTRATPKSSRVRLSRLGRLGGTGETAVVVAQGGIGVGLGLVPDVAQGVVKRLFLGGRDRGLEGRGDLGGSRRSCGRRSGVGRCGGTTGKVVAHKGSWVRLWLGLALWRECGRP